MNGNVLACGKTTDGVVVPLQVNSAGKVVVAGNLAWYSTLAAKTADYTVTATDAQAKVFHNTGAAGTVVFTLPAASDGLRVTFIVTVAQILNIKTGTTDTIRVAAAVSTATTGSVQASTIGNTLTLVCLGTQWVAESYVGTWTVA